MSKKKKTDLSVAVGKRIKQVQKELGFSNNEMAVTLGVSESQVIFRELLPYISTLPGDCHLWHQIPVDAHGTRR